MPGGSKWGVLVVKEHARGQKDLIENCSKKIASTAAEFFQPQICSTWNLSIDVGWKWSHDLEQSIRMPQFQHSVNFPRKFIHGIGFWFLNGSRFSSNEALQVSDGKTTKAGSILKFGCFWTFRRKWIFLFWLRAKFEKPQMRKMLEISRVKHRNGNN